MGSLVKHFPSTASFCSQNKPFLSRPDPDMIDRGLADCFLQPGRKLTLASGRLVLGACPPATVAAGQALGH